MNKRNSDSFIPDNAKARKTVTVTNTKHRKSVIVPLTKQLRSIRVDHEALKVGDIFAVCASFTYMY